MTFLLFFHLGYQIISNKSQTCSAVNEAVSNIPFNNNNKKFKVLLQRQPGLRTVFLAREDCWGSTESEGVSGQNSLCLWILPGKCFVCSKGSSIPGRENARRSRAQSLPCVSLTPELCCFHIDILLQEPVGCWVVLPCRLTHLSSQSSSKSLPKVFL